MYLKYKVKSNQHEKRIQKTRLLDVKRRFNLQPNACKEGFSAWVRTVCECMGSPVSQNEPYVAIQLLADSALNHFTTSNTLLK